LFEKSLKMTIHFAEASWYLILRSVNESTDKLSILTTLTRFCIDQSARAVSKQVKQLLADPFVVGSFDLV